jgi:hypothetical protein
VKQKRDVVARKEIPYTRDERIRAMITSRLTSKAQTTIPLPVRNALRLGPGDGPALVIAAGELETAHGLLWLAMITSAANRGWRGDVSVSDLPRGALP